MARVTVATGSVTTVTLARHCLQLQVEVCASASQVFPTIVEGKVVCIMQTEKVDILYR